MKSLVFTKTLTVGLFLLPGLLLHAAETTDHHNGNKYYECQLSDIEQDSNLKVNGRLAMTKSVEGVYGLSAQYTLQLGNRKSNQRMTSSNITDGHMKKQEVLASEEWELIAPLFGDEQPKGAHYFKTVDYEGNGDDLQIFVIHGEKGTKKSVVYLGWMPALCQ